MKTTIFNSMLGIMLIGITLCFSSCGGNNVDKSKCTSDYVYYERVWKMYSELFDNLHEDQPIKEILLKYSCKELRNKLSSLTEKELKNLSYNYITFGWDGVRYNMDEGDPFLGTDEEIYQTAKTGDKFKVQFKFSFISGIGLRKTTEHRTTSEVTLIYEDDDWKVYDSVSEGNTYTGLLHGASEF